jgi:RNA-dependent RNA polymerase
LSHQKIPFSCHVFVEQGGVFMGGLDETALLPEGCIFFQVLVSSSKTGANGEWREVYKPYVGPVLVTKHPVIHPGDVRMLMAVDIPALRKQCNVLLFSQHGDRPEPDKMSGSDLDGDEFAVTWDSRLFLGEWNGVKRQEDGSFVSSQGAVLRLNNAVDDSALLQTVNHAPLSYKASSGEPFQASLSSQDDTRTAQLVEYFFHFAANDILGQVVMLWQDHASVHGATSDSCQQLAGIHSDAVDFAKSGVAALIPRDLRWKNSDSRAHWREKKNSPSFHCDKVIGQLYDNVKAAIKSEVLHKCHVAMVGRKVDRYGQLLSMFDERKSDDALQKVYNASLGLAGEGLSQETLQQLQSIATEEREEFERQLVSLMNHHGIRSEGELFTGCIRKYHKANKARQNEIAIRVRSDCRAICNNHRETFFAHVFRTASSLENTIQRDTDTTSPLYELNLEKDAETIVQWVESIATKKLEVVTVEDNLVCEVAGHLAGAYYDASYSPQLRWKEEDESQIFFGFPWIVADVLLRP